MNDSKGNVSFEIGFIFAGYLNDAKRFSDVDSGPHGTSVVENFTQPFPVYNESFESGVGS